MTQAAEAKSTPVSPAAARARRLHELLAPLGIDPDQASVNLLSATRVDVGLWWRWRPVRVLACPDALVLLADGPRPFVQTAAYSELATSFYSHRSAELVLVPAPPLLVRSLKLPPARAWELLRIIHARCGTMNHRTGSASESLSAQPHATPTDKGFSHA
jgi:hypothetical protein